jgi:transcriptional regulator with XRE-family HTH domain
MLVVSSGERLRTARKRRGLSVAKAAERAGVSPSVWRNVERGTVHVAGTVQPYRTTERTLALMALAVGDDPAEVVQAAGLDPAKVPWDSLAPARHRITPRATVRSSPPTDRNVDAWGPWNMTPMIEHAADLPVPVAGLCEWEGGRPVRIVLAAGLGEDTAAGVVAELLARPPAR